MGKIPLNLVNLKYFVDAVKFGSISTSARANFVSQSAISQGIAKLEKIFGYKLITHQPKQFKITIEGQKLFESAKYIFQSIKNAEESFSSERKKSIEIACTHSFALARLGYHLNQAKEHLPILQLKCRLGHAYSIMEWVNKGVIDFGILLDNSDLSSFDCEQIDEGEYRLYVSKKCKEIDNLPFLLDSEERTETNLLKKAYKKLYDKNLPVLMEISSWEVVANLTAEGLGIGFFPDYVAFARKNFIKPLPHKIVSLPYKIYAIFADSSKRADHIIEFLQLLKNFPKT